MSIKINLAPALDFYNKQNMRKFINPNNRKISKHWGFGEYRVIMSRLQYRQEPDTLEIFVLQIMFAAKLINFNFT